MNKIDNSIDDIGTAQNSSKVIIVGNKYRNTYMMTCNTSNFPVKYIHIL